MMLPELLGLALIASACVLLPPLTLFALGVLLVLVGNRRK